MGGFHNHDKQIGFYIDQGSMQTGQRSMWIEMANAWEAESDIDFTLYGLVNTDDWTTVSNLVYEGTMAGCSGAALACTTVDHNGATGHIWSKDTVFREHFEWMSWTLQQCAQTERPPARPTSVDDDIDARSVSLHELGHWINLGHSPNSVSVMQEDYKNNSCYRDPNPYDSYLAERNYIRVGGHT